MNFFTKLFSSRDEKVTQPNIRFGRYTDVYKEESKYDCWDQAVAHFEDENYLASYRQFFEYLSDENEQNVQVQEQDGQLKFRFFQGSKEIVGFANADKLKAESKIARTHELNIGFLRRLVESNYNLKYGRYCVDPEGDISIVFDTLSLDASPYKVYYALKEIALASDKQDDLLVEEFDTLGQVNTDHIEHLPQEEKRIKIAYLRREIAATLTEVREGRLNAQQYPGGITYLLLELIYRLDFLIRPEGSTMETFERMHRLYFAADKSTARDKNEKLIKEFDAILQRPEERLAEELYNTISTFGITNPSTHTRLKEFIEGELDNMDWYLENKYFAAALAIPCYIAGYSLFYYSLTKPDRDFLLLFMQIMHQDLFKDLGFTLDYVIDDSSRSLNRTSILNNIGKISSKHAAKYPDLDPDVKRLQFDHRAKFAKSYLRMVANFNLNTPS